MWQPARGLPGAGRDSLPLCCRSALSGEAGLASNPSRREAEPGERCPDERRPGELAPTGEDLTGDVAPIPRSLGRLLPKPGQPGELPRSACGCWDPLVASGCRCGEAAELVGQRARGVEAPVPLGFFGLTGEATTVAPRAVFGVRGNGGKFRSPGDGLRTLAEGHCMASSSFWSLARILALSSPASDSVLLPVLAFTLRFSSSLLNFRISASWRMMTSASLSRSNGSVSSGSVGAAVEQASSHESPPESEGKHLPGFAGMIRELADTSTSTSPALEVGVQILNSSQGERHDASATKLSPSSCSGSGIATVKSAGILPHFQGQVWA
mmetsp:Transcript_60150/g.130453  ORF Transcript_60150/g.130453 Transcript_60150/m.130453 type:complete len:325 (-) Transcript_60150:6-980(-)